MTCALCPDYHECKYKGDGTYIAINISHPEYNCARVTHKIEQYESKIFEIESGGEGAD